MARFGRGQSFHPHLARPIVSTTAPASPILIVPRVSSTVSRNRGFWASAGRSKALHAVVAAAIVAPAPGFRAKSSINAIQAIRRPYIQRKVTNSPNFANPVITATVIVLPPVFTSAKTHTETIRREYIGRRLLQPHLPPGLFDPQPGPVAGATLIYDAVRRPVLSRGPARPHLAPVNLAAATPVTPFAPGKHVTKQARYRALISRRVPIRPSRWLRIEGVAATAPPLAPSSPHTLVANRRVNLGRKVIQAHTPAEIVGVPPFNYNTASIYKSLFRRPVRPVLLPHLAKALVTPGATVVPNATIQLFRNRVNSSARKFPQPHLAPPNLSTPLPQPIPTVQSITIFRVRPRAVALPLRPHLAPAAVPKFPATVAGRTKRTLIARLRATQSRSVTQSPILAPNTLSTAIVASVGDIQIVLGPPTPRWFVYPATDRWRI